jgi:hypothetical protein
MCFFLYRYLTSFQLNAVVNAITSRFPKLVDINNEEAKVLVVFTFGKASLGCLFFMLKLFCEL